MFRCLASWLRLGNVDVSVLTNNSLFNLAFEGLKNSELFVSSVDVICELIFQTQSYLNMQSIVSIISSRVLALQPMFMEALKNQDVVTAKGLTHIFSTLGESYIVFILSGSNEALEFVKLLLQCVSFPGLFKKESFFYSLKIF